MSPGSAPRTASLTHTVDPHFADPVKSNLKTIRDVNEECSGSPPKRRRGPPTPMAEREAVWEDAFGLVEKGISVLVKHQQKDTNLKKRVISQAFSFVEAGINLMTYLVGKGGMSLKVAEPMVNSYETALRISVLLKKYKFARQHLSFVRQPEHGRPTFRVPIQVMGALLPDKRHIYIGNNGENMDPVNLLTDGMSSEEVAECIRRVHFAFLDMVAMVIGKKRDADHVPFTNDQVVAFRQALDDSEDLFITGQIWEQGWTNCSWNDSSDEPQ
eukprot:gene6767-1212_t